jgi:hypothetical protein
MSKKPVNGKLVDRTPEEEIALQRLREKAGYRDNVGYSKKPKSKERFAKLYDSQFGKLMEVKTKEGVRMFPVLMYQWFKNWDRPFQMSTVNFAKNGFSRSAQKRALIELEKVGLISVKREPPKSPVITIL